MVKRRSNRLKVNKRSKRSKISRKSKMNKRNYKKRTSRRIKRRSQRGGSTELGRSTELGGSNRKFTRRRRLADDGGRPWLESQVQPTQPLHQRKKSLRSSNMSSKRGRSKNKVSMRPTYVTGVKEDDWDPQPSNNIREYVVTINEDGTITKYFPYERYFGQNWRNSEYVISEDSTYSYLMTLSGNIYAWSDYVRDMFMCLGTGENCLSMPPGESLPQFTDRSKRCCLNHGKIAEKLLKNGIIDSYTFLSIGEFTINPSTQRIEKISNSSGHFRPQPYSNDNFINILEQHLTMGYDIYVESWAEPPIPPVKVTLVPRKKVSGMVASRGPSSRGGTASVSGMRKTRDPRMEESRSLPSRVESTPHSTPTSSEMGGTMTSGQVSRGKWGGRGGRNPTPGAPRILRPS